MKKIILSLLVALIVNSADSQATKKNSLQQWNLKGGVKSVREASYQAVKQSGAVVKRKRKRESEYFQGDFFIAFNGKGNQAEKTLYNADGSIYRKIIFRYDEKENQIEENSFKADGTVSSEHKFKCTYDAKGNLVEKARVLNDESIGNKIIFTYDDKENMIENCVQKPDGSKEGRFTTKYDDSGHAIEEIIYKKDGTVDWKNTYTYDESGNNTEMTIYKGTKFIIRYINTYDEAGNLTEIDWCKQSGKVYRKYYMKYESDARGNWIKQTQYKGSKATYILEREIEYL